MCTNITEVVIPNTVTNIQDGAFYQKDGTLDAYFAMPTIRLE